MKSQLVMSFSKITLVFAVFAATLSPSFLSAQQSKPWEQIPIPKLHDFKPQQPKRIELKNGIVIFSKRIMSCPSSPDRC